MIGYFGTMKTGSPTTNLFLDEAKLENKKYIWRRIEEMQLPDDAKVGERFYSVMLMYGSQPLGVGKTYRSQAEAEAACAEERARIEEPYEVFVIGLTLEEKL